MLPGSGAVRTVCMGFCATLTAVCVTGARLLVWVEAAFRLLLMLIAVTSSSGALLCSLLFTGNPISSPASLPVLKALLLQSSLCGLLLSSSAHLHVSVTLGSKCWSGRSQWQPTAVQIQSDGDLFCREFDQNGLGHDWVSTPAQPRRVPARWRSCLEQIVLGFCWFSQSKAVVKGTCFSFVW